MSKPVADYFSQNNFTLTQGKKAFVWSVAACSIIALLGGILSLCVLGNVGGTLSHLQFLSKLTQGGAIALTALGGTALILDMVAYRVLHKNSMQRLLPGAERAPAGKGEEAGEGAQQPERRLEEEADRGQPEAAAQSVGGAQGAETVEKPIVGTFAQLIAAAKAVRDACNREEAEEEAEEEAPPAVRSAAADRAQQPGRSAAAESSDDEQKVDQKAENVSLLRAAAEMMEGGDVANVQPAVQAMQKFINPLLGIVSNFLKGLSLSKGVDQPNQKKLNSHIDGLMREINQMFASIAKQPNETILKMEEAFLEKIKSQWNEWIFSLAPSYPDFILAVNELYSIHGDKVPDLRKEYCQMLDGNPNNPALAAHPFHSARECSRKASHVEMGELRVEGEAFSTSLLTHHSQQKPLTPCNEFFNLLQKKLKPDLIAVLQEKNAKIYEKMRPEKVSKGGNFLAFLHDDLALLLETGVISNFIKLILVMHQNRKASYVLGSLASFLKINENIQTALKDGVEEFLNNFFQEIIESIIEKLECDTPENTQTIKDCLNKIKEHLTGIIITYLNILSSDLSIASSDKTYKEHHIIQTITAALHALKSDVKGLSEQKTPITLDTLSFPMLKRSLTAPPRASI